MRLVLVGPVPCMEQQLASIEDQGGLGPDQVQGSGETHVWWLENNQPLVGGRKGSAPTLAFRMKSPSCSTTHSSLDLMKERKYILYFPTYTAQCNRSLAFLLRELVGTQGIHLVLPQ